MSNAELIARARKEILPWPQELCVDMCRAFEEFEAENERLRAVINHAATVEDRVAPETAYYVIVGKMRAILESEDITR